MRSKYSGDLIASGKRRYEETDEPVQTIATDFGVLASSLRRYARRHGWRTRSERPPRDLPEHVKLADQLARETAATVPPAPEPTELTISERLERALERELAAVETMRRSFGGEPQPPADAERTARTLASLTDTLFKVRRLRVPAPGAEEAAPQEDTDGDDFREALARRIDAFVAHRPDDGVAEGGEPADGAAPGP